MGITNVKAGLPASALVLDDAFDALRSRFGEHIPSEARADASSHRSPIRARLGALASDEHEPHGLCRRLGESDWDRGDDQAKTERRHATRL
jgi:hypothetical protein